MKDNSFQDRRIKSEINSFDPLWVEFYKEFASMKGKILTNMEFNCSIDPSQYLENYPFPLSQVTIQHNDSTQKRGVDKRISFDGGNTYIIIEEKVRYKPYNDVFVERWEDKRIWKVGWAWDTELVCNYLAYAIWPSSLCIFINFKQLQFHLFENEEKYMKRKQYVNDDGGYLSTGFTLSFAEIQNNIPDLLFIDKS